VDKARTAKKEAEKLVKENQAHDKELKEIQKNKRKESTIDAQKPPKVCVVHILVL